MHFSVKEKQKLPSWLKQTTELPSLPNRYSSLESSAEMCRHSKKTAIFFLRTADKTTYLRERHRSHTFVPHLTHRQSDGSVWYPLFAKTEDP